VDEGISGSKSAHKSSQGFYAWIVTLGPQKSVLSADLLPNSTLLLKSVFGSPALC
jgi:hypothetical protein